MDLPPLSLHEALGGKVSYEECNIRLEACDGDVQHAIQEYFNDKVPPSLLLYRLRQVVGEDVSTTILESCMKKGNQDFELAIQEYYSLNENGKQPSHEILTKGYRLEYLNNQKLNMEEKQETVMEDKHEVVEDKHEVVEDKHEVVEKKHKVVEEKQETAAGQLTAEEEKRGLMITRIRVPKTLDMKWKLTTIFERLLCIDEVNQHGVAYAIGLQKGDVIVSCGQKVISPDNVTQIGQAMQGILATEWTLGWEITIRRTSTNVEETSETEVRELGKEPPLVSKMIVDPNAPPADGSGWTSLKERLQYIQKPTDLKRDTPQHEYTYSFEYFLDVFIECNGGCNKARRVLENRNGPVLEWGNVWGSNYTWVHDDAVPNTEQEDGMGAHYDVVFPRGALGMTVENLFERTVVISVLPTGLAKNAGVQVYSWLVGINHESITHWTHSETLAELKSAPRPLHLRFVTISIEICEILRMQWRRCSNSGLQPNLYRVVYLAMLAAPYDVRRRFFFMDPTTTSTLLDRLTTSLSSWQSPFGPCTIVQYNPSTQILKCELQNANNERWAYGYFYAPHHEASLASLWENATLFTTSTLLQLRMDGIRDQELLIHLLEFYGHEIINGPFYEKQDEKEDAIQCASAHFHLTFYVLEQIAVHSKKAVECNVLVNIIKRWISHLHDNGQVNKILFFLMRWSVSKFDTCRIVALSLMPLVYSYVSGDLLVQIRGTFLRLCCEERIDVRIAAVYTIGVFVHVLKREDLSWLMNVLEKFTTDENEVVRTYTVSTIATVGTEFPKQIGNHVDAETEMTLRLFRCQLVPLVNKVITDAAWVVRSKAAEYLPIFCQALTWERKDIVVDLLVALLSDTIGTVRHTAVDVAYDLSHALLSMALDESRSTAPSASPQQLESNTLIEKEETLYSEGELVTHTAMDEAHRKILHSILPSCFALLEDKAPTVRHAVAILIARMATLVGSSHIDHLVPLYTLIFDSKDEFLKVDFVLELCKCGSILPLQVVERISTELLRLVSMTPSSRKWRIRADALTAAGILITEHCSKARSIPTFLQMQSKELLQKALYDDVCSVRTLAATTLGCMTKVLGIDWLRVHFTTYFEECYKKGFPVRMTSLMAIQAIIPYTISSPNVLTTIWKTVFLNVQCKVYNVRYRALETLLVICREGNSSLALIQSDEFTTMVAFVESIVETRGDMKILVESTIVALKKLKCL